MYTYVDVNLQGNKNARAGGNSADKSANSLKNDDEVDISAITGMIKRNEVDLFGDKTEVDTGPAKVNINPLAEENITFYHSQVAKTLSIPVQRYRVGQRFRLVLKKCGRCSPTYTLPKTLLGRNSLMMRLINTLKKMAYHQRVPRFEQNQLFPVEFDFLSACLNATAVCAHTPLSAHP